MWLDGVPATDAISEWSEYAQEECTCIADTGYTLSGSAPTYEGTLYQEIQTGVEDAGWINSNSVFLQWLAQVIVGDSNVSSPTTSGSDVVSDVVTTSADYPINGVSLLYSGYPMTTDYSSDLNSSNWDACFDYHAENNVIYKVVLWHEPVGELSQSIYIYEGDGSVSDGVDNAFEGAFSSPGVNTSWSSAGSRYFPYLSWINDYTYPEHSITDLRFNANDTIFVYSGSLEGSNDTNGVRGSLVAFYQAGVWTEADGTVLTPDTSVTFPASITVIGDNATYDTSGAITNYGTVNAIGVATNPASDATYQDNLNSGEASVTTDPTPDTSSTTTAGNTVGNTVTNPTTPTDETQAANFKLSDLEKVFPFCIPFDLYDMVAIFAADPVAPQFDWPIYFQGQEYDIDVDLSEFDTVAATGRVLLTVLFLIGLAFVTRDLIRG
jgi:hypothetical protein